ncbi:hypothetical protein [Veillonella parvula]|nr:hypothetical protein [Veillonella parvula]MBS6139617.1 hypothetical protein [Veillonella parvula]
MLVATVPTVYGIETRVQQHHKNLHKEVATVPTACGMRRRVRDSRGAERR